MLIGDPGTGFQTRPGEPGDVGPRRGADMARAVVLLSGGLDSTTTFAVAKAAGLEVFALSVDYGQRHRVELDRAAAVAKAMGAADHRTVRLDLRAIGGSALTADVAV